MIRLKVEKYYVFYNTICVLIKQSNINKSNLYIVLPANYTEM